MYQNGRRDGRGRMDGMHFDIIPFALTPSPRKVTPPRKVPPPRKLFSNCPVPCGPAPQSPHRTVLPLSMVHPGCPGAHLVLYTARGNFYIKVLILSNTCPDKPAGPPAGRQAGQPSGREGRGPLLPGPSAKHKHQKTVWKWFFYLLVSISNFSGGAGGAKSSPRHVRIQSQREGLIYICVLNKASPTL